VAAPTVRSPKTGGRRSGGEGPLHLTVMAPNRFETYPLPERGTVTVGRDEEADVRLADELASRVHLRVGVEAGQLWVEDLGSSNGTFLRGERLSPGARAALLPGEAVTIGFTHLMVQRRRASVPARPARADALVTQSEAMRQLYQLAERAASGRTAAGLVNVLILGETGVGKEVMASWLHRNSPRAEGPFVCINCAALTEGLLESELFGHEKGAFTGATQAKLGLLETAARGTVFLDEIGEMPAALQTKLLRALENREITRVGGLAPRAIDVRFVAATNRDLEAEVTAKGFRQDLYYRLNGITLTIPPLRARSDEIEPLARHFLAEAAGAAGRAPPALSPEAAARLRAHTWPGNVRELRNVIERALILGDGGEIGAAALPLPAGAAPLPAGAAAPAPEEAGLSPHDRDERQRILEAMAAFGGNQTRAARKLKMARGTLIERLKRYGVKRPKTSTDE
jgi:two-component system response regulator AtoC